MLFFFLFFSIVFYAQVFVRSSDEKTFISTVIAHKGANTVVERSNFKTFVFDKHDKVLYNNKLLDFSVSNDTLFFFDKVKEIEEVEIVKKNNGA